MQITCPGCATSYQITKAALGPQGRRVACARCATIWLVAEPAGGELVIPAPLKPSAGARPLRRKIVAEATPATSRSRPRASSLVELGAGAGLLALSMAILGLRADIVRFCPPADAVYAAVGLPVNLRGLELRDLRTMSARGGSEPVLRIEGKIANVQAGATEVPPIELSIRDQNGNVLYRWTAPAKKLRLAAGETISFQAQLAEPPAGAHDVLARFAAVRPETVAAW